MLDDSDSMETNSKKDQTKKVLESLRDIASQKGYGLKIDRLSELAPEPVAAGYTSESLIAPMDRFTS